MTSSWFYLSTKDNTLNWIFLYNFPGLLAANPICPGWDGKQPLLPKYRSYNQHLLLSASTPFKVATSADLDRNPSSCLARIFQGVTIDVRMTKVSLPRIFNNSYFRVAFNSRLSRLLKRDCLLANHTHVYQSVFNNGATDWRCFIVNTRRTDALFIRFAFFSASCAQ